MRLANTEMAGSITDKLRQVRYWLADKYRKDSLEIAELQTRLAGRDVEAWDTCVSPNDIIWNFGLGRSTWLRNVMGDLSRHHVTEEPLVGRLFGDLWQGSDLEPVSPDFVMANAAQRDWIRSIRDFVPGGAKYAPPLLGPNGYMMIRNPAARWGHRC